MARWYAKSFSAKKKKKKKNNYNIYPTMDNNIVQYFIRLVFFSRFRLLILKYGMNLLTFNYREMLNNNLCLVINVEHSMLYDLF